MPARITAVSTRPELRASKEWLSSSIANTIPASGVLNAAATPAAPPPSTMARYASSRGSLNTRPIVCMMTAATCTVGPSRPIDAPQVKPRMVKITFPTATRTDSVSSTSARLVICDAAMTWGMPLPCAPTNTVRVSNTLISSPAGGQQKRQPGPPGREIGEDLASHVRRLCEQDAGDPRPARRRPRTPRFLVVAERRRGPVRVERPQADRDPSSHYVLDPSRRHRHVAPEQTGNDVMVAKRPALALHGGCRAGCAPCRR